MTRKVRVIKATSRLVVSVALLMTLAPAASGAVIPGSTCSVFPSSNVWHLDVSRLPVDPRSHMWKRAMHARTTSVHPDFGPPDYGIPFDVVDAAHPDVSIAFQYAAESDEVAYPFGPDVHIDGGSDRHAIMVDATTCTLYELYGANWNAGSPTAGSGAAFDLTSNALRPAGWTSADAAGLPIFSGLLRWDEVVSGTVDHAIRMTAACTHDRYIWPARHHAGTDDRRCPPMGARFRLRADFDASGFGPKRYGMIVADNGSDWYFQGTVDPSWSSGLIDQLKRIPSRAFVAVDERACRVAPDSGRFSYGRRCPAPRR
jgi:hypothetical protein